MSSAALESKNWIQQNYDKVLLILMLVALLASSLYLLLAISGEKSAIDKGAWQANTSRQIPAVPLDVGVLESNRNVMVNPFLSSGAITNRLLVSEQRVACIDPECQKSIDYHTLTCTWCNTEQPPLPTGGTDRDQDQIPDEQELALGLDPGDPYDARGDSDGDGFSNLEEYDAKTDLNDPESIPDPIVKLRIAKAERVPLDLLFEGILEREQGLKFQLNSRVKDRSYFVEIGDEVEGYMVEEYAEDDPRGPTLVLSKGAYSLPLVKGQPEQTQEWRLILISLLDGERFQKVGRDSIITVRGIDYKVIEIDGKKATLQDLQTGKETSISRITPVEIEALRPGGSRQSGRRAGNQPRSYENDRPRTRPTGGRGI